MLGLPDGAAACLFDLDGVPTDTASVHRAAWKQTFDELLAQRDQSPFTGQDYLGYVDGKPRPAVFVTFSLRAESTCPRATPTTRLIEKPSTASAIASMTRTQKRCVSTARPLSSRISPSC